MTVLNLLNLHLHVWKRGGGSVNIEYVRHHTLILPNFENALCSYLACQGFFHPLKWSQCLFDRKFYPDFRIRPNVPWQFFFSVPTTGSQCMPGDQKSISLLLSLLSNHYQLEALSFLSTNPCNSIWFFQPVVYETFKNVPLSKSWRSRMLSCPELLVRHKD